MFPLTVDGLEESMKKLLTRKKEKAPSKRELAPPCHPPLLEGGFFVFHRDVVGGPILT